MHCNKKHSVLGVNVSCTTYAHIIQNIITASKTNQNLTVCCTAVHGIMEGYLNPEHRYRLNHFQYVLPDGQPVRWALNMLSNCFLKERVYGPKLMDMLCQEAEKQQISIFLFGNTDTVLKDLVTKLLSRYPTLDIAGTEASQFCQLSPQRYENIIKKIKKKQPGILFVGLGTPRQEVWMYQNAHKLRCPIITVGASFDFLSQHKRQAPLLFQAHGVEWLFRLIQEPRRLWRRYILFNPLYILLVCTQVLFPKSFLSHQFQNGKKPKMRELHG